MLDNKRALLTATVALAVATVGAACGSDDNDSAGDNAGQAQAGGTESRAADGTTADTRPTGGDKAQIRHVMQKIQADYIAGDAPAYCAALTAAGRKQVADVGKTLGLPADCEQFIAKTSKMSRDSGIEQKPTKVLRIAVDGNQATATISDGGRPPQPLAFVKQDGEWKLPDPGLKRALQGHGQQAQPGSAPAPQ